MAMQGNTVLDFAELQLAPPRTRCELFVSANGIIEKLASGFLKPFLMHLRVVEEQVARGSNSVRLGHPPSLDGKSWFTKGTLERFVRFVSTPEVLERVKSVEDELAQLEQVRTIQASNISQAEDIFVGANEVPVKTDGKSYLKSVEKKGSFKLQRRIDDVVDRGAEASKLELLRAMDLRLLALQQEQSTAFERAVAAGFCSEHIADLIAFSDHFGAERLRTACKDFLDVLKSRHEKFGQPDSKAISNCSTMILQSVSGVHEKPCHSFEADVLEGSHQFEDERMENSDTVLTSAIKGTGLNKLSSRGSGGPEVRKRWGPPENLRTALFIDGSQGDSASSNESSNVNSARCSPEVQISYRNNIEQDKHPREIPIHKNLTETLSSVQEENLGYVAPVGNVLSAGYMGSTLTQSSQYQQADVNRGESLSLPSFQNGPSNGSEPSCPSSLQEASVMKKSLAVNLNSNKSENNINTDNALGSETLSTCIVAPARRLSVQDAISLFENKQRRDSVESVCKSRTCKQGSGRASLEGAGTSLSGSTALKGWDFGKSPEVGAGLQDNGSSFNPEVGVLDIECSFHAPASRPLVLGTIVSKDSLQARDKCSLAHSVSETFAKVSSNAQYQTSLPSVSASVGAVNEEHSASSDIVTEVCGGDWRKQFKLQLEKSLAKDCFTKDSLVEENVREHGFGTSMSKKTLNHSKVELRNDMGPSIAVPSILGSRSKEIMKNGVLLELRQGQNGLEKSELCLLPDLTKPSAVESKEEGETNETVKLFETSDSTIKRICNRESLGSSSANPLDHDMQALVILADDQTREDDRDSDGSKGRLYEQYRKLRDAKLMEDQNSKRAEREAKLRMMEETLRKRKEEMDARVVRLSKNIHSQDRSLKVAAVECDLHTPKKEQQGVDVEVLKSIEREETKSIFSSMSLPVTPCTSKEVDSSLKPQGGKTAGGVLRKGATPPRSSSRPIPSVSSKVTSRSTTVGAGSLHKSVAFSRGDNPLARSVPCFANLRKENTKPSAGRTLGSARVHPKNGAIGGTPSMFDTTPLEAKGNVPPTTRTNFSRSGPTKQEQRNRSAPLRKSYVTASEFKSLSTSSDDGMLVPRKAQKEIMTDSVAQTKLRRSAVASLPDSKPFLKKGRGIGPATHVGVKQKLSSATDTKKSSDEPAQRPEVNYSDGASQVPDEFLDGSISREHLGSENMEIDDDAPVNFSSVSHGDMQAMRTMDSSQIDGEAELDESILVHNTVTEPLPGTMNQLTERACHTISFPIDIETHSCYAVAVSTQSDANLTTVPVSSSLKQEGTAALSRQDEDTVECIQNQLDEAPASPSFRATSPPHENGLPVSLAFPPPSSISMLAQHKESSPPSGAKLESSMGCPGTWISCQVQHSDETQFEKKWAAFQKPVTVSQPKESVRGFKRLLKFGRKSRPSDIAAGDCISASTTSEGDDELEEQSRFVDEVSSRGRLSERRYNDVLGGNNQAEEEGSAHCLRSSIPTPPANFKMRDDHMGAGTMLRAPRSFFSLSSFRGKGSELKSRSRDHGHG